MLGRTWHWDCSFWRGIHCITHYPILLWPPGCPPSNKWVYNKMHSLNLTETCCAAAKAGFVAQWISKEHNRSWLRNEPMWGVAELCASWFGLCIIWVISPGESSTDAATLHLLAEAACSQPALIFLDSSTLSVNIFSTLPIKSLCGTLTACVCHCYPTLLCVLETPRTGHTSEKGQILPILFTGRVHTSYPK